MNMVFLGKTDPAVEAWINAHCRPDGHAETRVKYSSGATETFDIEGELNSNSITNIYDVEEVDIGNAVTSIGNYAFRGCSRLTSVTIQNGVTSIGDAAFQYCISLASVTIPGSVTSIGEDAFNECDASLFDTTTIPGVKLIDGWAVGHADSLSGDLNLAGIHGIGDYAFADCGRLTSVTIPNTVTSISERAFSNCIGLTSVTIPDSVTSIGSYAFYTCESLASVTIGNGVETIGSGAFQYCVSLASVTMPNSVTSIGNDAFWNCSRLASLTCYDGYLVEQQGVFFVMPFEIGPSAFSRTAVSHVLIKYATGQTSLAAHQTVANLLEAGVPDTAEFVDEDGNEVSPSEGRGGEDPNSAIAEPEP